MKWRSEYRINSQRLVSHFEIVKEVVVTNGARVFQPVYENGLENPFTVYFAPRPRPRPRPRFMQKVTSSFFRGRAARRTYL